MHTEIVSTGQTISLAFNSHSIEEVCVLSSIFPFFLLHATMEKDYLSSAAWKDLPACS